MLKSESDETAIPIPATSTSIPAMIAPTRKFTVLLACCLTIELTGRPRCLLCAAARAIYCADGAATLRYGPVE
jgi:hypothetical protein